MKSLAVILGIGLMGSAFSLSAQRTGSASEVLHNTTQQQQYFRHIMFRETPWASYRGIYPVSASNNPDFAHYEFNYDELGRITEVSYQINDSLIRGNEVWDSFIWFAPKVKISYQDDRETHHYFDSNDQRVHAHGNVYSAIYELDSDGKRIALAFFDEAGEPSESEWNIHRYDWRYDNGKVYEKRFNLAGEQQTIRPLFKFHEVELEYDRDGKLAFVRNLGLDGTPTNNDSGAAIDRITYDRNGNFIRWQVYDKDGLAVEGNRPMVHLGEHLYDDKGNKVGLRGYDRQGKQMAFSWGAYEHVRTFDQFGNQDQHMMYSEDGSLHRHLLIEYSDDNSEISWLKSLDEQRNLVSSPMLGGAAALQYHYKDDGETERRLFNADMSPFEPPLQGSAN